MSGRPEEPVVRRPWHVWLVSIIVFALYVGGARDYLLILMDDTDYIRGQFGQDGVIYFADYPLILRIIWTVNILGGLLAPVLLIARNRWAFPVAVTSASAQVVLLIATFALLNRWAMLGTVTSWFDIGIGIVTALFAGYCAALRHRLNPERQ